MVGGGIRESKSRGGGISGGDLGGVRRQEHERER